MKAGKDFLKTVYIYILYEIHKRYTYILSSMGVPVWDEILNLDKSNISIKTLDVDV